MFRYLFPTIFWALPLLTLLWWFWAHLLSRRFPRPRIWRIILAAHSLIFLLGYLWFLANRLWACPFPLPTSITAYVMLWGLIILPFITLPLTLLWFACRATHWLVTRSIPQIDNRQSVTEGPHSKIGNRKSEIENDKQPSLTRRQLLASALVAAPIILTFSGTLAAIPQRRSFRIRRITVDLPNLPPRLHGITIAHVADTHVGKFTRGPILDQIAAATNNLHADLVLFTGDLIDYTLDDLPQALAMLRKFSAPSGVFAIEGNHDLFQGRQPFEQAVRNDGHTLLLDQSATAYVRGHPVQLLGIRWQDFGQSAAPNVHRVAALRDPDAFPILLAHHPHAFDTAITHNLPLTLAGHTHGGQLMLTPTLGFGPALFRYWSGLYKHANSRLVVTNGVGNWFPLRINAPAEITHLTLHRA